MSSNIVSASYNPTLSNYAFGIAPTLSNKDAAFLAPTVVTPAGRGQYKAFDDANAFKIYNTRRALGGKRERIVFDKTDAKFDCSPSGIEVAVDDAERDAAGEENGQRLLESKTKMLITASNLSRTDVTVSLALTKTAEAGIGAWLDGTTNDPVNEIDATIQKIATNCGMMPNRIWMPVSTWITIKNHAKVRGRLGNATQEGFDTTRFAALLANPNIDIMVSAAGKDTTKPGGAKTKQLMGLNAMIMFIASDSPSEYDPSFMKTFATRMGNVAGVKTYRDESCASDVVAIDWTEQQIITGSLCGAVIALS